jgi:hypothetical protein
LLLLGGFIEGLPGDGAFFQPALHRLAHFVARQAGPAWPRGGIRDRREGSWYHRSEGTSWGTKGS